MDKSDGFVKLYGMKERNGALFLYRGGYMKKTILSLMLLATGVASAMQPEIPVSKLDVSTAAVLGALKTAASELGQMAGDAKDSVIDAASLPGEVAAVFGNYIVKHPKATILAAMPLAAWAGYCLLKHCYCGASWGITNYWNNYWYPNRLVMQETTTNQQQVTRVVDNPMIMNPALIMH